MDWNTIIFPGLGDLTIHMNRIALEIGSFSIKWYGVIIACGAALAYFFCHRNAKKFGIIGDQLIDFLLFAVPIGILGARGYYILFYLDLFRKPEGGFDVVKMIRIWDGGLAIYGAVIACATTLFIFCRVKKISFLAFADLCVFGLLIGQAIGRWGNFVNIEAYGGETTLPWRMGIMDRFSGQYMEVHPTFFYEFAWNMVGLVVIYLILRKWHKFDGISFCLYFVWYGVGRFWIEGLRTDSLYLFQTGIRVSQAFAALSALVAAAFLFYLYLRHRKNPVPLYRDRERTLNHGDNH